MALAFEIAKHIDSIDDQGDAVHDHRGNYPITERLAGLDPIEPGPQPSDLPPRLVPSARLVS